MPRECRNKADNFCYICGQVAFRAQKCTFTEAICKAYKLYFGIEVGDQERSWAPHVCCSTCATKLRMWRNGKRLSMGFAIPMIWREPRNHVDDCYFCVLPDVAGITQKKKAKIEYPSLPSAIRPVPHSNDLPVPDCPGTFGE